MKIFRRLLLVSVSAFFAVNTASANTMFVGNNGNENMYSVDVVNVTGVLIGDSTIDLVFGGLGFSQDGTLYGWTTSTNSLYTVDVGTGVWTLIGGGTTFCGDTFDIRPTDSTGIVFDICTRNIYTVNLADGSTTLRAAADNFLSPNSAFASDGTMYQLTFFGPAVTLQTVDIDTGEVVDIGPTGVFDTFTSLGFNPDDGMLYALGVTTARLYRFDPNTGSGLDLGVVTGLPITGQYTMATFNAVVDADGDGVLDVDDYCPGTQIAESVPTTGYLNPNHWALTDEDTVFDTVTTGKGKGPNRSYTIEDTAGCSCEQIIDAQGLGEGQILHGCSIGTMDNWVELVNP